MLPEFDMEYYARGRADVLAGKTLIECIRELDATPLDERNEARFSGYFLGAADGILTLIRSVAK